MREKVLWRLLYETAARAGEVAPRSGGDVRLRYFVPVHEMEMCVHATIAASVVLGNAGLLPAGRATIESPLGPLGVTWDTESAVVDQFAPTFGAQLDDISRVITALRLASDMIAGPAARHLRRARN